jgi:hypothetical protein
VVWNLVVSKIAKRWEKGCDGILDFLHCDKYLGKINFRMERFVLAHGFNPLSADSIVVGPW